MIRSIDINNFQSHKNTHIEFDPGVNVIIGPSDSGKSAILRALRWVVWNRPLGDSFRSNWGGDTVVDLNFDDCTVQRFKGKNDFYRLWNDPEEPALEFTAFGTAVPDEIEQALNLSELNIQNQMDAPFLLSENPGQVSRHFNKIARIDLIDTSLTNIESWIRGLRQDVKASEDEIERHRQNLEEYEYLDRLEADVEVLEGQESRVSRTGRSADIVHSLIQKVIKVETEIEQSKGILQYEADVLNLLSMYKEQQELGTEYSKLRTTAKRIWNCTQQIKEKKEILKDENIINELLELYNKHDQLTETANKLNQLITAEDALDKKILLAEGRLEDLENKWHENMPDVCPLCDQRIE